MLDPLARIDMFQFLKGLTKNDMGILLVSHIVDEVRQAETIYCLDSGEVDCFNGFDDFSRSDKFWNMGWNVGVRHGLERKSNEF